MNNLIWAKNGYDCEITTDFDENVSYYVRLYKTNPVKISFNQFLNSIQINFLINLDGAFTIPPNLLVLKIQSNLGTISNVPLRLQNDSYFLKEFTGSININFSSSELLKGDKFLEMIDLNISLDVNQEVFNSSNLQSKFANFNTDLLKINFDAKIDFCNYFPSNKLSEYYIATKYKSTYKNLSILPTDFFNWESDKCTIKPQFWFNQVKSFENLNYISINKIYDANVNNNSFYKNFDKTTITLDYYIDNQWKTLDLNLDKFLNTQNEDLGLFLNIKTLYDYDKKELYQSSSGVSGIYFPVPTNGKLKINLVKNNIKYTDEINFSFGNNFYSNSNNKISVEIKKTTDTSGKWTGLTYA